MLSPVAVGFIYGGELAVIIVIPIESALSSIDILSLIIIYSFLFLITIVSCCCWYENKRRLVGTKIKGRGCVNVACVMNYMIEMVIIYYLFKDYVFLFLFLLLGMDLSIPRDTSFTNLLEDNYDEYMSGSSHISDEDNVPQAQAFNQMSPPQVESTAKKL